MRVTGSQTPFNITIVSSCPTQDDHLEFKLHNVKQNILSLVQWKGAVKVRLLTRPDCWVKTRDILLPSPNFIQSSFPQREQAALFTVCCALVGFCLLLILLAAGGPILISSASSWTWWTLLAASGGLNSLLFSTRRKPAWGRISQSGGASNTWYALAQSVCREKERLV